MAGRRPKAGAKAKAAAAARLANDDPGSDDDTAPLLELPEEGEVESSPDRDGPRLANPGPDDDAAPLLLPEGGE